MRPCSPATGAHSLDGEDGVSVRQDRELVLLRLNGEDLPAWERDDSNLLAFLLKHLCGLEGNGDLRTGRDEGEVGLATFDLLEDVATLGSLLDRATLKLSLDTYLIKLVHAP